MTGQLARLFATGLCLLLASLSCSGNGGEEAGHGEPVTEDDALSSLAGAVCRAWFDCPCRERQASWSKESTCRDVLLQRWESDVAGQQGRGFEIDVACIEVQLAAYRAIGCASEPEAMEQPALLRALADLEYCHAVTRGLGEGERCEFIDTSHLSLSECAPGLRCESGVCTPQLPGDGEACTADRACDRGLECSAASRCEVPQQAASPCSCGEDEVCSYEDAGSPRCVPKAKLGERCGVCVAGAYCEFARTGVCTAFPAIGEPCHTDRFGMNPFCDENAYCVEGVCEQLPGAGEPCAPDTGRTERCAAGLRCSYMTKTCLAPSADGGSCSSDEDCVDGLVCDGHACVQPPPVLCD